jgi:hypothetical protein
MTRDAARCPTCGAKIVRYRHTMNRGLVGGLVALAEAGGEASLADLGLTRNQVDNFQKLRYWGLVEKVHRDDGTRVAGVWRVTREGYKFLAGGRVYRAVWTYRGEFECADDEDGWRVPTVSARSVAPGYQYREEYARRALPVFAEAVQGVLLDA